MRAAASSRAAPQRWASSSPVRSGVRAAERWPRRRSAAPRSVAARACSSVASVSARHLTASPRRSKPASPPGDETFDSQRGAEESGRSEDACEFDLFLGEPLSWLGVAEGHVCERCVPAPRHHARAGEPKGRQMSCRCLEITEGGGGMPGCQVQASATAQQYPHTDRGAGSVGDARVSQCHPGLVELSAFGENLDQHGQRESTGRTTGRWSPPTAKGVHPPPRPRERHGVGPATHGRR